jgi:uncharacterized protein YecE (DUF72 family)
MPQRTAPQFRIGCSGWSYKSWRGLFYPRDLPPSGWLDYYTARFDTVEVNATFYRLPPPETFAAWARQTPAGFLMAVKASRYLTHLKRLRDPIEPVGRFLDHAAPLASRLGPVLYQLPAKFGIDLPRLEGFVRALPHTLPRQDGRRRQRLQHVIEFRDPSWYDPDTFALLAEHRVAVCLHDMPGAPPDLPPGSPFVYVRFHGASGRYHGSYGPAALDAWAGRLVDEWRKGLDVYAYFNNDPDAAATRDAQALRARVDALATGAVPKAKVRL